MSACQAEAMRRSTSSLLLLLALALAVAACGSDAATDKAGTGPESAGQSTADGSTDDKSGSGSDADACSLLTNDEVKAALGVAPGAGADKHPDDDIASCTWLAPDQAIGPSLTLNLDSTGGLKADAWLAAIRSQNLPGFKENRHAGNGAYLATPSKTTAQAGVIVGDKAATIVLFVPPPGAPDLTPLEAAIMQVAGRL